MKPERGFAVDKLEVYGCVEIGPFEAADAAHGVPVLFEDLDFVRLDPAIVRLVIREGAHHQLGVRSVAIGQHLRIPYAAGGPFPQLGPADNVVVADVHDAGLGAVVVAAHEVLLQVPREAGDLPGVVLPPAQIDAGVVRAAVPSLPDGPVHEIVFGVVGGDLDTRREDNLVCIVHVDGDIRPVQDCMGLRRSVEHLDRGLDVRSIWVQCQADDPSHSMSPFGLSEPDGLAAIRVFADCIVHGHVGCVAVVMKDAPLHPAADPGAQHSDQGGFDDMLAIEELVAVGLVRGRKEPAADLGENR